MGKGRLQPAALSHDFCYVFPRSPSYTRVDLCIHTYIHGTEAAMIVEMQFRTAYLGIYRRTRMCIDSTNTHLTKYSRAPSPDPQRWIGEVSSRVSAAYVSLGGISN